MFKNSIYSIKLIKARETIPFNNINIAIISKSGFKES
jgi:hypothetical protein